jgi:hypothetical protein
LFKEIRKSAVILVAIIFICLNYSYAAEVDNQTAKEEAKAEKPARQVRDKDDAIQIAKDYLQEEEMQSDYHLVGHMTKPLAKLKDGIWNVVFLKKKKADRTVTTESVRIKIEDSKGHVVEVENQEGFFIDRSFR